MVWCVFFLVVFVVVRLCRLLFIACLCWCLVDDVWLMLLATSCFLRVVCVVVVELVVCAVCFVVLFVVCRCCSCVVVFVDACCSLVLCVVSCWLLLLIVACCCWL